MSRRKRRDTLISLFRGLAATFHPRTLKRAFQSVTRNKKEYLCFFIAVLAIQTGFWTLALTTDANLALARRTVDSEYSHHITVVGLSDEQRSNLENACNLALSLEDEYLADARYGQSADGTYMAYITLRTDRELSDGLAHIESSILSRITREGWSVRTTPLYSYETDYAIPYLTQFWLISVLWLVLGVAVLLVLYLIRLDHFKFIYGVYMTCGADFSKLFGTAAGELLAVSALTLLPSALLGGGIAALIYLPRGVALAFSVRSALAFVGFHLLCVLAAVYMPMRRMARKSPVSLMASIDNGALVSSPRRSFRLFGQTFPGKYELYTFWRMRAYYARLVLSAVAFAALFISGLYIAELEDYKTELDPYEYVVRYGVSVDEQGTENVKTLDAEEAEMIRGDLDTFLDSIYEVEGVSYADWSVTASGGSTLSHLLLKPGQTVPGAGEYIIPSDERESEGYTYAMQNYAYTAIDRTYIDNLVAHELCTVEGDPYAVLEDGRAVIVSEDVYNARAFGFEPGDKIMLAAFERANGGVDIVFDPLELLRRQIDTYQFTYIEYTVCAVMRGMATEDKITFGVSYEEYEALTGEPAVRNSVRIYMENGTDLSAVRAAEGGIRRAVSGFSGWSVTPTGNYFEAYVKNQKNDRALTLTLAALILVISPLVWFFSQIMFYRKRQGEFEILYALGAPGRAVARLYRIAGGVLSGLAFLVTVGLSLLCNFLVYTCINTFLPKMGLIESVYYHFELSLPALIACVLVSAACGFLSCEVPYRLQRQRKQGYDRRGAR